MAKKKNQENQEGWEAQDFSLSEEQGATEEPEALGAATAKVQIRTKIWQGQRLEQRRRANLLAFPDWAEHEVSDEQLALLEADEFIEVVRV